jgi:hypothetical protein
MSDRMMSLAAGLGPAQEIYSIDESFIDLTGVRGDLVERSHKIRDRILQWVGIPCCVGIGATKTLAKLANHIGKTAERKPGIYPERLAQVCNLSAMTPQELKETFTATEVGEVWGIGRRISKQLKDGASIPCKTSSNWTWQRSEPDGQSCWNALCVNYKAHPALIWTTPQNPRKRLPAHVLSDAQSPASGH